MTVWTLIGPHLRPEAGPEANPVPCLHGCDMHSRMQAGAELDMAPLMGDLTLDVVGSCVFGVDLHTQVRYRDPKRSGRFVHACMHAHVRLSEPLCCMLMFGIVPHSTHWCSLRLASLSCAGGRPRDGRRCTRRGPEAPCKQDRRNPGKGCGHALRPGPGGSLQSHLRPGWVGGVCEAHALRCLVLAGSAGS